jgi:ankyrin repeat protein
VVVAAEQAALVGDAAAIELLVAQRALDVRHCDPRGNTALHCAVVNGHVAATVALVAAGTDHLEKPL